MARGWKRVAEWTLARAGVPALALRRRAPSAVILAFHDVVPEGERVVGDRSLHLNQRTFADHLDLLAESHDVVALEDITREPAAAGARPRAAITFDDAYRGAVTVGVEELAKRGFPATIFVTPGLLGGEGCWWDRLAVPGRPLDRDVRTHALNVLRGRNDEILAWAREAGIAIAAVPPHARIADEEELARCQKTSGISLGAHTWTHPNLAALTAAECGDELDRSRAWVEQRAVRFCNWLAYPYGLYGGSAVDETKRRFAGALRMEGGHAVVRGAPTAAAFLTPRVNVPRGMSMDGLRVRLGGIRER